MVTALTLILSIFLQAPSAVVVETQTMPRENPWAELQQVVETARTNAGTPYPLLQALAGWSPADLLAAAIGAAEEGQAREESAAVDQHLALCLEYYPVVATGGGDVSALLSVMENPGVPKALRVYLLGRLLPGAAPPSLFNQWWLEQTAEAKVRPRVLRTLAHIAQAEVEPELVVPILETLFRLHYQDLSEAIGKEPAYVRHFAQLAIEPSPKALLDPGVPQLQGQRKSAMDRRLAGFGEAAMVMAGRLDAADPRVRDIARALVERVVNEVPVPNREELAARIAGAAETTP